MIYFVRIVLRLAADFIGLVVLAIDPSDRSKLRIWSCAANSRSTRNVG